MKPLEALISNWRQRLTQPLSDRESVVVGALALAYFAAALGVASLLAPDARPGSIGVTAALLVAYVLVSRIRFVVGAGYVSAEQVVFVPLIFCAPINLLPLLVPLAFLASDLPDILSGKAHAHRWVNALADSWFVLGSVLVIGLLAPGAPSLHDLPVYLLALVAQVALGTAAAVVREHFVGRIDWRDELCSAAAAYQLDVLLSPVGLAVAFAATELGPVALLAIGPVAIALGQLAHLHQARCEHRVTAHDDEVRRFLEDCRWQEVAHRHATAGADPVGVAAEWRSAPELAFAVAGQLGLPVQQQREITNAARELTRIPYGAPNTAGDGAPCPPPLREHDAQFMRLLVSADLDEHVADGYQARRERVVKLVEVTIAQAVEPPDPSIRIAAHIIRCCRRYSGLTAPLQGRAAASHEVALEAIRRDGCDPDVATALAQAVEGEAEMASAVIRSPWLLGRAVGVSLP